MKEEHYIEMRGKRYVLYEGLLAMAHERGLRGVDEEIIQLPTSENGDRAIVKATAKTEDGRAFSGIGDASPENVGRNIVPHVLRMASTRAKARCFRDMCNIGTTALEELSDGEESSTPTRPATSSPERSGGQEKAQWGRRRDNSEGQENVRDMPATRKQKNYLEAIVEDAIEEGMAKFEEMAGKPLSELSRAEASEWIAKLSGRAG